MKSVCLFLLLTMSAGKAWAQDQPVPQAPNVQALPGRVVKDLSRLVSRTPIVILTAGGVLSLAARPDDGRTVAWLSGNRTVEESLDAGSGVGNGFAQAGAAVAVYGLGWWLHRPAVASVGADLIEAQAVTGLVTHVVKIAVDRNRPDGGHQGFPSGHASATFATAAVLTRHFGWRYGSLAYAGAAYVGASRIADRRHYLSDVTFGAAVGIAGAYTLKAPMRTRQLTLSITPGPRGMMVSGQLTGR